MCIEFHIKLLLLSGHGKQPEGCQKVVRKGTRSPEATGRVPEGGPESIIKATIEHIYIYIYIYEY